MGRRDDPIVVQNRDRIPRRARPISPPTRIVDLPPKSQYDNTPIKHFDSAISTTSGSTFDFYGPESGLISSDTTYDIDISNLYPWNDT